MINHFVINSANQSKGTALLENFQFYSYFIIGKPEILFLLQNWNFVYE